MSDYYMRTTCQFPAAAIADAAGRCKKDIEEERKKDTAEVFAKYRNYRKFNWWALRFEPAVRTDEQIRELLHGSYSSVLWRAENKYVDQYRVVKRLLALASVAPPEGWLVVTAEDFYSINTYYCGPEKGKTHGRAKSVRGRRTERT